MPTPLPDDSERPNGPRSLKGTRTRVRLLEAAKEIFEENGFLEGRISDIAEKLSNSSRPSLRFRSGRGSILELIRADIEIPSGPVPGTRPRRG